MQKEVGPLNMFARCKSIDELRSMKRKKRKITSYVANYHLRDPVMDEVCGIVTPNLSITSKNQQRWHNNRLDDTDSEVSLTRRT